MAAENDGRRRPAGANERRCVSRQDMGLYRSLAVGATYYFNTRGNPMERTVSDKLRLSQALRLCVDQHPILSAVIQGADSEAPQLAMLDHVHLDKHIEIAETPDDIEIVDWDERTHIESYLHDACDTVFEEVATTPPWKIIVHSLPPRRGNEEISSRKLILFTYYHSHGDGKAGLAFHRTFLAGLDSRSSDHDGAILYKTPQTPLFPPLEKVLKLPISWSYLLATVLGETYFPPWIRDLVRLRTSATASPPPGTWLGAASSQETKPSSSDRGRGLQLVKIPQTTLSALLAKCKTHSTTLTGLLHQVILRALSDALSSLDTSNPTQPQHFLATTPLDLRPHAHPTIPKTAMSLTTSVAFETLLLSPETWKPKPLTNPTLTSSEKPPLFACAAKTTHLLRESAKTERDQPVALLKYLSNYRPWLAAQAAQPPEASYELSNLGNLSLSMEGEGDGEENAEAGVGVEDVVFAQPGSEVGPVLFFNVVGFKGAGVSLSVTWLRGVLGVGDEEGFVREVCERVGSYVGMLGDARM